MPFTPPSAFTTRPTLEGTFGMSASTHWLATAPAQAVLERGGNAFDAVVAGGFVLQLVEPHLNGPGGDLTGVFATAEDPRPQVLNGQGPAPERATIAHFRAEGLDLVPGAGALSAAVPGSVDAWLVLLRDHGTWELAEVLEYALGYAEHGHPLAAGAARAIEGVAAMFREHWPSSAALWLPGEEPPRAGQMVRNPEYAGVLRRLIAAGEGAADRETRIDAAREEWRTGLVAQRIEEFSAVPHRHSTGTTHAGVIRAADLAAFEAGYEDAVTVEFRGFTIAKTGPWGQGPVLLQALKILEGFEDDRLDPSTACGAHTVLEALKLALADRDTHYGHAQLDLGVLLGEEYAASRRALIGEESSHEFRPGEIPGGGAFRPPLLTAEEWAAGGPGASGADGSGEPTLGGTMRPGRTNAGRGAADGGGSADDERNRAAGVVRGDTCHIDVVDAAGNIVAITPSGGWLQSSPAIPGLGFALGTRLQMSWLDESSPSRLEPGRRPRTTLTPTLVLRDGVPVAALGSPGGDQQDQWQLLLLLRLLVGGYDPQQAIDAPAFHTTSMPGSFWPRTWEPGGAVVEDRLGEAVIGDLERRGHRVTRAGEWSLGRLSVVQRDVGTGVLRAAANPRGAQGYAAGR